MIFLTSRISTKDEFSDLIINKDEEAVGESAEPPAGPDRERAGIQSETQYEQTSSSGISPGVSHVAYLSGYMRSATSMPGQ